MSMGRAINSVRKKSGLSQTKLAGKAGITQTYLSMIENDKKEANPKTLRAIANGLDIPVEILLFMSLSKADIPDGKKEAFSRFTPIINRLINAFLD